MSEYQVSAALLRSLGRFGADPRRDDYFESGRGTRAASQPHIKQSASSFVERAVNAARRQRCTPEERRKEIERRRKWAGSNMPDRVRACYSEAERAALSVIGEQCKRRGFCDLCLDEIARLAGVGRTSVQNALRKARSKEMAHISVRERPQERGQNLTNIIKIICGSWLRWLKVPGFKRLNASETRDKKPLSETGDNAAMAFEKRQGDSDATDRCIGDFRDDEMQDVRRTASGWIEERSAARRLLDRLSGSGSEQRSLGRAARQTYDPALLMLP